LFHRQKAIRIISSPKGNSDPNLLVFKPPDSSSPVVSLFDLSECRILHVEFGTDDLERQSFYEAKTYTEDELDRSIDMNVFIA